MKNSINFIFLIPQNWILILGKIQPYRFEIWIFPLLTFRGVSSKPSDFYHKRCPSWNSIEICIECRENVLYDFRLSLCKNISRYYPKLIIMNKYNHQTFKDRSFYWAWFLCEESTKGNRKFQYNYMLEIQTKT